MLCIWVPTDPSFSRLQEVNQSCFKWSHAPAAADLAIVNECCSQRYLLVAIWLCREKLPSWSALCTFLLYLQHHWKATTTRLEGDKQLIFRSQCIAAGHEGRSFYLFYTGYWGKFCFLCQCRADFQGLTSWWCVDSILLGTLMHEMNPFWTHTLTWKFSDALLKAQQPLERMPIPSPRIPVPKSYPLCVALSCWL